MSDYEISQVLPAAQLAEAYVSMFIEPSLDMYTEPSHKARQIKVSLQFIEESLECFNLELPENTILTRLQFKAATSLAIFGEGPLFTDKEFISKYRRHYSKRLASWWLEPAVFEPVTVPRSRMYFNEDTQLHLAVENKFDLLNTSHSQCERDKPVIAFDCMTDCRIQFLEAHLHCTPNLQRKSHDINHDNVTMCVPADYMNDEKFRLEQIQHFDVLAAQILLNRTAGTSLNANSSLSRCQSQCKSIPKCMFTSFNGHATSQALGAGTEGFDQGAVFSSIGNVRIIYKMTVMYFKIEQKLTFSWITWVANIGGVLEFWVGAGLLSMMHLLVYMMKQCVYKLRGWKREGPKNITYIKQSTVFGFT